MIRELAKTTRDLAGAATQAIRNVETIAERAVEKVLERRRETRRRTWYYRASWLVALAALATLVADHWP